MVLQEALYPQLLTADEIIRKADEVMNPATSFSKVRFVNKLASGEVRTFEYAMWSKDRGDKVLLRYTAPRRVEGQAILLLNRGDDIWMYFPRTDRIRKMATHAKKQKFEGSGFTYEDFGSGNAFVEKFHATLLGEEERNGTACYRIQLDRKPQTDISYSRLILWIDKKLFIPLEIRYFDEHDPNRLKKILKLQDIQIIQGIPTAGLMIMKSLEDNTETRMELISAEYNLPIPDDLFTENALRRK